MSGLKTPVQVLLFFKWSKLYTTVSFNSHSLASKTKSFFFFFFFYSPVIKVNKNQIMFLSVKSLLNLERKQI